MKMAAGRYRFGGAVAGWNPRIENGDFAGEEMT